MRARKLSLTRTRPATASWFKIATTTIRRCRRRSRATQARVRASATSSGADGAYTASGSTVTIEQGGNLDTLSYCVKGDTLTLGNLDGLPSTVFSRE